MIPGYTSRLLRLKSQGKAGDALIGTTSPTRSVRGLCEGDKAVENKGNTVYSSSLLGLVPTLVEILES